MSIPLCLSWRQSAPSYWLLLNRMRTILTRKMSQMLLNCVIRVVCQMIWGKIFRSWRIWTWNRSSYSSERKHFLYRKQQLPMKLWHYLYPKQLDQAKLRHLLYLRQHLLVKLRLFPWLILQSSGRRASHVMRRPPWVNKRLHGSHEVQEDVTRAEGG